MSLRRAGRIWPSGTDPGGGDSPTQRAVAPRPPPGPIRLADACLDSDREVHRVLTEKVFPRQAGMRTVAEWAAGL
jgi:hypothetical protein